MTQRAPTYGSAPGEAPQAWVYYGDITRIHDGDTFTCNMDMGCHIWRLDTPVRVAGINAPELATAEGKQALAFAETLLQVGMRVRLVSLDGREFEKYGRLLAHVYFLVPGGTEADFGAAMVAAGHAVVYNP